MEHSTHRPLAWIDEALKVTGFDVLNLANNHMMDWGIAGLRGRTLIVCRGHRTLTS